MADERATQQWVAAFDGCRPHLALFAQAMHRSDLAAVHDSWVLCLGARLCPTEYSHVATDVAAARPAGSSAGLIETVEAARSSSAWPGLGQCVSAAAARGGGDVEGLWAQLAGPRAEWFDAERAVASIRGVLRREVDAARRV